MSPLVACADPTWPEVVQNIAGSIGALIGLFLFGWWFLKLVRPS